jgi:hypothetical protein
MPTTIAVRKAKETMAASTLSLILRVIVASSCRNEPALWAVDAASWAEVYVRCAAA